MTVSLQDATSSADNVLVLMLALRERGSLRVLDAAQLLGVTPPTAHRLLSALKRHDLADQNGSRAYVPGPSLDAFTAKQSQSLRLTLASRRHLEDLVCRTGETVHLVALEGNGSRFVTGVESERVPRVPSRVGLLLPAHLTAGGMVLLAQASGRSLMDLYPYRRVDTRDGRTRDLAVLRRELATVRRRGYALNLEASEQGVHAVGVPVGSSSGQALAAIVLASPAARLGREQLIGMVPLLRDSARALAADALAVRAA